MGPTYCPGGESGERSLFGEWGLVGWRKPRKFKGRKCRAEEGDVVSPLLRLPLPSSNQPHSVGSMGSPWCSPSIPHFPRRRHSPQVSIPHQELPSTGFLVRPNNTINLIYTQNYTKQLESETRESWRKLTVGPTSS